MEGVEIVRWNDKAIIAETQEKLVKNLLKTGMILIADIKKSFGASSITKVFASRSGRKRQVRRKIYYPSKPGEPPNVRTGTLRRSITSQLIEGQNRAEIHVGSILKYAKWLELGTSKMKARPFLRPALERNKDKIRALFENWRP